MAEENGRTVGAVREPPPLREPPALDIHAVRSQVVGIDQQVPLLDGSWHPYINLDNAASTPALRPVFDRVNAFLPWYSSVHRGSGFKSQLATWAYEQAHEELLRFFGADPAEHVAALVRNSTEAINKLARRFPLGEGDVVLCSLMEHHSNDLPWRGRAHIQRIGITPLGTLDEDHLDHLLRRYAGRVRLVAVSGASNVTGYVNPIYRIAQKAHEVGAQLLVDGAQLVPHRRVDMGRLDDPAHIDYLAISGHKMYAPYGTGALIGRRDLFAQGDPDLVGGGAISLVTLTDVAWAPLPDKEEAGSPNVVGAVALAQAARCLEQIGMDALAEHEAMLTAHALERLREIDGLELYGDTNPNCCPVRVGVISFTAREMDHAKVAAVLSYEAGIGVRSGCFCAQPYIFGLLKVSAQEIADLRRDVAQGDFRRMPGMVRLSFGCYNTVEEVDIMARAIEHIVRGEYRGSYVQEADGRYHPEGLQVDWGRYF
ncbi:MAG TPA: aminotransferase class V-fold PLP-dependent enzyme [Anaerolineae bacterium]|nr:aminotransferase class V-fold PLP-dependent enzyme [Anaerolineae bacterium]HOR01487.1 aminotransferase class V-fold PLP-dependent enzyme [Anaerolineae bacterium]HPL30538.1 aminotransferase class V-fold PLP-dependent enzyme [Anaerolineae bacterium]